MKLVYNKKLPLYKAGFHIVKILQDNKHQAFWVGGIVRNLLLKRESDNVDIATDATPDEVEQLFLKKGIKTKPVGKRFGSILAIVQDFPIEITTFRSESRYSDKRHPDQVEFIKDYLDDAKRRDFTINALYFDPAKNEVYDPTNGLKDLKGKLLKFVGDPKKRIEEDALRMLRGIRLATQLGFRLEKNSFAAIKTRAKYIQDISGERIKAELDKILLSENRAKGAELLGEVGLLKFIIPEMEPLKKFTHKSKQFHLEGSMFVHTILALGYQKRQNLNLSYALLFHDIGKPLVAKRIFKNDEWIVSSRGHGEISANIFLNHSKKLKFSKANTKVIEWLIRNHMTQTTFGEMKPKNQVKLAMSPYFDLLVEHWECDERACKRAVHDDLHTQRYEASKKAAHSLLRSMLRNKSKIENLAKGELVMKYSNLKPGKQLGKKIQDVKIQILLQKINNEKDLQEYLAK